MKAIHWIIAAAALASVQPAQAGVNDPEVIIYRFPGVKDDGRADFTGVATVFHCTNFSGVTENVRFVTRQSHGVLASNMAYPIAHLDTLTASTHVPIAYFANNLATFSLGQGTTAIAATPINIIATGRTIEAANPVPTGVALRGIGSTRFR